MGLNQIFNIIKSNRTIIKHAKQIIIWDTQSQQIQVIVDTDRNIFAKTLKKFQENNKLIKDAFFVKTDGSCNSYIIFKIKEA